MPKKEKKNFFWLISVINLYFKNIYKQQTSTYTWVWGSMQWRKPPPELPLPLRWSRRSRSWRREESATSCYWKSGKNLLTKTLKMFQYKVFRMTRRAETAFSDLETNVWLWKLFNLNTYLDRRNLLFIMVFLYIYSYFKHLRLLTKFNDNSIFLL